MRSDRELLVLAGRAVGIVPDLSPYNGGGHGNDGFDILGNLVIDWHNGKKWNPLRNDGDALRLAGKLRLRIEISSEHERTEVCFYAEHGHKRSFGSVVEPWGMDRDAATRRAIVLAAANIVVKLSRKP